MVVQGAFKVELVEAKTKLPLTEHFKDGRCYAEVEPGTQFLLRIQKVARHEKRLVMVKPLVDGQSLGWRKTYLGQLRGAANGHRDEQQHEPPDYFGLYERKRGGKVSTRALECIRPKLDPEKTGDRIGIVEVLVYESTYVGERTTRPPITQDRLNSSKRNRHEYYQSPPPFEEQTVSSQEARSLGMKCVRAKPGTVELKDQVSSKRHRPGRLLEVITIHYCSLPGLMHAGILPVPKNFYAAHRTFQLVKKRSIARASSSTITSTVSPKRRRICNSKIIVQEAVKVTVDDKVVSKQVLKHIVSNSDLYDLISELPVKLLVNE